MLTESHDEEQIIARVAALDSGKAEVVCCVRVPAGTNAKKRLQEGPQTPLGGTVEHLDRTVCSSATMCANIRT